MAWSTRVGLGMVAGGRHQEGNDGRGLGNRELSAYTNSFMSSVDGLWFDRLTTNGNHSAEGPFAVRSELVEGR